MVVGRRETTAGLVKAANSYWLKKGFSCTNEIGIAAWGKLKVDVLAMNLRGELIIVETKSGVPDFTTDDKKLKWMSYLSSCNRFYWCFTEHTARLLKPHFARFKESGCGVLVLDDGTGWLRCIQPAKWRPMKGAAKKQIIIRLAWRAGDVSKRNARRTRVFLGENNEDTNNESRRNIRSSRRRNRPSRKRRTRSTTRI